MARACSVCTHPRRTEIDDALAGGGKIEAIASQFGMSKSTIGRHKLRCLHPRLAAAARILAPASAARDQTARAAAIASGHAAATPAEVISYGGLVDALARSLDRLESAADSAASDKAIVALATISGQLHRAVETAAKLCGLNKAPDTGDAAPRFTLTINIGDGRGAKVITGAASPVVIDAAQDDDQGCEPDMPAALVAHKRRPPPLPLPDFGAAPDAEKSGKFSLLIKSSGAAPA